MDKIADRSSSFLKLSWWWQDQLQSLHLERATQYQSALTKAFLISAQEWIKASVLELGKLRREKVQFMNWSWDWFLRLGCLCSRNRRRRRNRIEPDCSVILRYFFLLEVKNDFLKRCDKINTLSVSFLQSWRGLHGLEALIKFDSFSLASPCSKEWFSQFACGWAGSSSQSRMPSQQRSCSTSLTHFFKLALVIIQASSPKQPLLAGLDSWEEDRQWFFSGCCYWT